MDASEPQQIFASRISSFHTSRKYLIFILATEVACHSSHDVRRRDVPIIVFVASAFAPGNRSSIIPIKFCELAANAFRLDLHVCFTGLTLHLLPPLFALCVEWGPFVLALFFIFWLALFTSLFLNGKRPNCVRGDGRGRIVDVHKWNARRRLRATYLENFDFEMTHLVTANWLVLRWV